MEVQVKLAKAQQNAKVLSGCVWVIILLSCNISVEMWYNLV